MTRRAAPGRRDQGEVVARDGFTGLKSATAPELPDAVTVPLPQSPSATKQDHGPGVGQTALPEPRQLPLQVTAMPDRTANPQHDLFAVRRFRTPVARHDRSFQHAHEPVASVRSTARARTVPQTSDCGTSP